jgi:hypothetical protein
LDPVYVYIARAPTTALKGLRDSAMSILQNGCRHLTQRRSPLRLSRPSILVNDVEAALQHGLLNQGNPADLVFVHLLSFPAYVYCMVL